jgi:SAM-dependent methyltransferase
MAPPGLGVVRPLAATGDRRPATGDRRDERAAPYRCPPSPADPAASAGGVATLAGMANEAMRANWATGAEGWVRNERIFDAVFAPFTAALLGVADLGTAQRVLDVGCGAGTLLDAAVAAGAEAVGVDISPGMVEAASRRVPAATVVTADAQTVDLLAAAPGAPFDRVVSRFGVMFFADPAMAFANIRSATAPGARLAFVCWREGEDDSFMLGLGPLNARLADPLAPPPPGSPGPLGLAHADRVHEVLTVAGWSDVTIEPVDGLCDYSIDGSDGVEERLTIALSGMVGRAARAELEPRLGPDGWRALLDEARDELRAHLVDGAVRFVGHTWLVTASNG